MPLPLKTLKLKAKLSFLSADLASKELVQELLKQQSVWAIIVAQYTQSWGLYGGSFINTIHFIISAFHTSDHSGIMNWLPSYITDQFGVEVIQEPVPLTVLQSHL